MAATAHHATRSDLLAVDDSMEISSDAGRPLDDDIDIDDDLPDNKASNTEDEYMQEGGMEQQQEMHIKDDVMVDSENEVNSPVPGNMEEDIVNHDEELRDVSDAGDEVTDHFDLDLSHPADGLEDPQSTAVGITPPTGQLLSDESNADRGNTVQDPTLAEQGSEGVHESDLLAIEQVNERQQDAEVDISNAQVGDSDTEKTEVDALEKGEPPQENNAADVKLENVGNVTNVEGDQRHDIESSNLSATQQEKSVTQVENDQAEVQHAAATALFKSDESQELQQSHGQENNVTRLHSAVVVYEDTEIHLFPPPGSSESQTYFLKDDSLAYTTIGEMLRACRDVLGESINENDELEIEVAELGLTINEGSIHASDSTFADILEVFVQLCNNDGVDNPDSLYVTLRVRRNYLAHLTNLRDSVKAGKGLSQLEFLTDSEVYDSADDLTQSPIEDTLTSPAERPRLEILQEDDDQKANGQDSGVGEAKDVVPPYGKDVVPSTVLKTDISDPTSAVPDLHNADNQGDANPRDTILNTEDANQDSGEPDGFEDDFIDFGDADEEEEQQVEGQGTSDTSTVQDDAGRDDNFTANLQTDASISDEPRGLDEHQEEVEEFPENDDFDASVDQQPESDPAPEQFSETLEEIPYFPPEDEDQELALDTADHLDVDQLPADEFSYPDNTGNDQEVNADGSSPATAKSGQDEFNGQDDSSVKNLQESWEEEDETLQVDESGDLLDLQDDDVFPPEELQSTSQEQKVSKAGEDVEPLQHDLVPLVDTVTVDTRKTLQENHIPSSSQGLATGSNAPTLSRKRSLPTEDEQTEGSKANQEAKKPRAE